ncbi:MAG: alpha-(1-_3)-arabinofuranosyltransferase family protein, partial [Acidimicrobiales bacterium]
MTDRLTRARPRLAFVALCYLPLLLTSPGQVVADTKSYLYLDPGRLLARAGSMWDPHVGLGTVTHQNIGFLWPMGPYYWLMEEAGVPDWAAQRIWLGSIMCAAGLGVRYLLRTFGWRGPGVAVAMVAYACTPYLLTIAVRISAILLPFAALPWMLALTVRAIRTRSWRHPAVFALVVASVGTSNATSILLAGLGPLLWVAWEVAGREVPRAQIAAAVARIGGLTLATNAWWIAGLTVQATNGIDVLQYTESVQTTAAASSAQEVLRGLGYWFFYGDDPVGPWVGPSRPYQTSVLLLIVTFAIPTLALAGGALARWSERTFFATLALLGLVLAVGPYPYDQPSPVGAALKAFLHSDVGMAMRSLPRAAPLVVLGLAVMLGAGVHAITRARPSVTVPLTGLVLVLIVAALPPLWLGQLAPENLRRAEDIPAYWIDAGRHLDETDDGTRVIELPGSDFTSYRWGTTIDPVTPGLTDRPLVARELVPMGSPPGANLVKAFDTRLQLHIAEPGSVAPIARLLRSGQVLVRSDLAFEHYNTARPREVWAFLEDVAGLGAPVPFGSPGPNIAVEPNPMQDELDLTLDPDLDDPPPVAVLPVDAAPPIVTTKPTGSPVIVAGDGDGLVDSAIAGLIDGRELVRYSAALTDDELDAALTDDAVLIVTDSNRRRGERWGSIRYSSGYTEPEGLEPLRLDRTDARLPVFPSAGDEARTIALHRGLSANATSYGALNELLPDDRPANAVDGDPTTAWRTARDLPVEGERLELTLDEVTTTSTLRFLAPPAPVNRWITRMALRFDGGEPVEIDLDERSRTQPGQTVDVGARTFRHLSIEVVADSAGPQNRYGGLTSSGFAEVGIGDLLLDEIVRPPVDLLERAGRASLDHALAIVLTRLRAAPTESRHADEERFLSRELTLPTARAYRLEGTVRTSPRADDARLSGLLDHSGGITATSSARLPGRAGRASAALDGDLATAWTTPFEPGVGAWLEVAQPAPAPLGRLDLEVVADARHSMPLRLGIEADGARVATVNVPARLDDAADGDTVTVPVELATPVLATTVRVVVDEVQEDQTREWSRHVLVPRPVAIAELGWAGTAIRPAIGAFASGCRDDLLSLDGAPLPVRVEGSSGDAAAGGPLRLATCDGAPLTLPAGSTVLRAADGRNTGLDIDRVTLRSSAGGLPAIGRGTLRAEVADDERSPTVEVLEQADDAVGLRVSGARPDAPLWIAFGQSFNLGWTATVDQRDLGPPALIDGFGNGWLLDAPGSSFEVALEFAPQRRV